MPSEWSEEGSVSVALPQDVHAALAMRHAASVIVVAHQQVETGMQAKVLYGQGQRLVLEEHVTGGGLHTFSVMPTLEAVDRLMEMVDPGGTAAADAGSRTLTLTEVAAGEGGLGELNDTRCVTILGKMSLRSGGEPVEERISVYALTDRVEQAEPRERDGSTVLEVAAVASDTLRRRLGDLLADGRPGSDG